MHSISGYWSKSVAIASCCLVGTACRLAVAQERQGASAIAAGAMTSPEFGACSRRRICRRLRSPPMGWQKSLAIPDGAARRFRTVSWRSGSPHQVCTSRA